MREGLHQGRLVKAHRGLSLCDPARGTLKIPRWAPLVVDPPETAFSEPRQGLRSGWCRGCPVLPPLQETHDRHLTAPHPFCAEAKGIGERSPAQRLDGSLRKRMAVILGRKKYSPPRAVTNRERPR